MKQLQISQSGSSANAATTSIIFNPLDIASLVGWYDFTDPSKITLATGISQIADKSTAGNDLVQATGGNQPSYTPYGGQNDFGFASFVSGKTVAKTVSYTQPFTVFIVAKLKSWVHQASIIKLNSGSGDIQTYGLVDSDDAAYTRKGIGVVMGSNWSLWSRAQYIANQTMIFGCVINNTSTRQIMEGVFFDDNLGAGNGAGTTAINVLQIGGSTSPDFDMYEVLYFNGALSKSDCLKVDNYFHTKYQTTAIPLFLNLGDSITVANIGTRGYAQRVANARGWQWYNLGVAGTSIYNNLRNIYGNYIKDFPKSAYISISFGTNDSPIDATWNASYDAVISNIIGRGFKAGKIILITPPYSSTRTAKLTAIQGYLSALATKYGCIYVDCVTPMQAAGGDSLLSDGAHPTAAGHQIMADTILALLP